MKRERQRSAYELKSFRTHIRYHILGIRQNKTNVFIWCEAILTTDWLRLYNANTNGREGGKSNLRMDERGRSYFKYLIRGGATQLLWKVARSGCNPHAEPLSDALVCNVWVAVKRQHKYNWQILSSQHNIPECVYDLHSHRVCICSFYRVAQRLCACQSAWANSSIKHAEWARFAGIGISRKWKRIRSDEISLPCR